jgi:hypothetical protein
MLSPLTHTPTQSAAHRQTSELAFVGAEREVRGDGHLLILRKELELHNPQAPSQGTQLCMLWMNSPSRIDFTGRVSYISRHAA